MRDKIVEISFSNINFSLVPILRFSGLSQSLYLHCKQNSFCMTAEKYEFSDSN